MKKTTNVDLTEHSTRVYDASGLPPMKLASRYSWEEFNELMARADSMEPHDPRRDAVIWRLVIRLDNKIWQIISKHLHGLTPDQKDDAGEEFRLKTFTLIDKYLQGGQGRDMDPPYKTLGSYISVSLLNHAYQTLKQRNRAANPVFRGLPISLSQANSSSPDDDVAESTWSPMTDVTGSPVNSLVPLSVARELDGIEVLEARDWLSHAGEEISEMTPRDALLAFHRLISVLLRESAELRQRHASPGEKNCKAAERTAIAVVHGLAESRNGSLAAEGLGKRVPPSASPLAAESRPCSLAAGSRQRDKSLLLSLTNMRFSSMAEAGVVWIPSIAGVTRRELRNADLSACCRRQAAESRLCRRAEPALLRDSAAEALLQAESVCRSLPAQWLARVAEITGTLARETVSKRLAEGLNLVEGEPVHRVALLLTDRMRGLTRLMMRVPHQRADRSPYRSGLLLSASWPYPAPIEMRTGRSIYRELDRSAARARSEFPMESRLQRAAALSACRGSAPKYTL